MRLMSLSHCRTPQTAQASSIPKAEQSGMPGTGAKVRGEGAMLGWVRKAGSTSQMAMSATVADIR